VEPILSEFTEIILSRGGIGRKMVEAAGSFFDLLYAVWIV
jgi:hypothetical protein